MTTERPSLRQLLLGWLFLPIMVLACVWAWSSYRVVMHFANRIYDWELSDSVLTLARQVGARPDSIENSLPPAARQMLEFDQYDQVFYAITDDAGHLLAGNADIPVHLISAQPEQVGFYDDRVDGRKVRLAEYVLPVDGNLKRRLHVSVAETVNKRERLARDVLLYIALPQVLFVLGIALLVWIGIGRVVSPFRKIRDAISQRNPRDLKPIDDTNLPAEAYEQVHVINELMERLGQVLAFQKQFIADAAHQLRTPVTVLRTQTELALRTEAPGDLRQLIQGMERSTARLSRLTNQLLNLGRAELGSGVIDFSTVSLATVVEEIVAVLAPKAVAKGVAIHVRIPDQSLLVKGDRQLLEEMVSNVMDNAILYTQAGGRIDISLHGSEAKVTLVITDNGPGIPEAERLKVMQRFYRGESSGVEGSGLGLAIANEIAVLHQGEIRIDPAKGSTGLAVSMTLPA
jgi:two-component system sensor histidine kinase TctE